MGSRLFREQEGAGSTPAAPTGVSSNGRAVVLQTADGGSIPSTPTHSPIGGRDPALEAGDVGSIPARGTHGGRGVLECTPRCERGGVGSIPAGHPNNWVWVNGWPPGPEPGPRRFDSCRPDSRALLNGGQPVPKTGVVVMSPRGSIPPLSSLARSATS